MDIVSFCRARKFKNFVVMTIFDLQIKLKNYERFAHEPRLK